MRVAGPARLMGAALLTLGLALPARAADSPAPVEDPGGLLLPLPECGAAGALVPARLAHRVRGPAPRRDRPSRLVLPPALLPLPEAVAWQAFLACTLRAPGEAATAGLGPLHRT